LYKNYLIEESMKSSIDISYRRLLSMLMHKNTSIIMVSTIAAILTMSIVTFALPNQAFAQRVIFSPGAQGLGLSAGSGAAEIKVGTPLGVPLAALRAGSGAAEIKVGTPLGVPLAALRAGSGAAEIKVGSILQILQVTAGPIGPCGEFGPCGAINR
jgi:hypothetical protein